MRVALVLLLLAAAVCSAAAQYETNSPYDGESADSVPADASAGSGGGMMMMEQQQQPGDDMQFRDAQMPAPPAPAPGTVVSDGSSSTVLPAQQPFIPALVQPQPTMMAGAVLPPVPPLRLIGQPETPVVSEDDSDPELLKLNAALEAVKEDIVQTAKQIADERKWVAAVSKITTSYADKMRHVQEHIVSLRREMAKLYKKKKAIENLKLQHALEAKLKEANDNLLNLQNTLKKVEQRRSQLDKSHLDLRTTISGIEQQLTKLKGEPVDPAANNGQAAMSTPSSASASASTATPSSADASSSTAKSTSSLLL